VWIGSAVLSIEKTQNVAKRDDRRRKSLTFGYTISGEHSSGERFFCKSTAL
jgi:hypothetical protein